jgi:hypothetical protein
MKVLIISSSKGVVLEVNAGKTKHMLLSRHQKAGQNHDINIGDRSFENVSQFKYFGMIVTNLIRFKRKLRGDSIPVTLATIRNSVA